MAHLESPFRIVIVGGGVAGLVASGCLQKLGIDHVVLERHVEVAPALGAGIAMWPHGLRVLHQLGCLDAIKAASVPINRFQCRGADGRLIQDNELYTRVQENHGIGFYPLERRRFLQILYDALPDKSFIKTDANVEAVDQNANGVEVRLSNGDVEVGDMVLGCDGVHSVMRSLMWDYANKTSPGLIRTSEKTSLTTTFKSLLVVTPAIPELGHRDLITTYNKGFTFLATSQPNAVYLFVIFRNDQPFSWPKQEKFTDEDAETLAEIVADKPVTDQILFGEIWKRRIRASVISLEEGVMEHWHHGRIVLAGDAVHKLHPNLALGGNSAIEGVACLINCISQVIQDTKGPKPSGTALNMAFATYQKQQQQRMRELMNLSNLVAKAQTYATPAHKLFANWVLPLLDDRVFADWIGAYVAKATNLGSMPSEGFPSGRLSWSMVPEGEPVKDKKIKHEVGISIAI
ncbi:FAD binding domain protein [Annulohypoxylon maeteangense]|uniref:FAD binding domain protein n=1 Tax=Annulohypoxylon maeteangense TaxID=1927788 RepID=UPI002007460E|nr:FAD binding domain protein [Annulohypoxylon maeteangense]KAI0886564.1 FAD binding domain protein [Annulohypoxylon maeteangense]